MLQTHSTTQQFDPMTSLQNRWYNGLATQLQADRTMLQLLQPASPILQSDQDLWMYANLIPPTSLTFNTTLYGADLFFNEYAAMASEQVSSEDTFEKDIGEDVYVRWQAYVNQLNPPPTLDQLPHLFLDWASINAPDVANIGATDLVQIVLTQNAQQALKPYSGPHAKPIDFNGSFAQLQQMLQNASGTHFSFASSTAPSDVSDTWTHGRDTDIYGLWNGCHNTSRLSLSFARSKITATISAQHYVVWTSTPGTWYNSSLLNNAYTNAQNPPWLEHANPNWADVFGTTGSMPQLIASLLIMDGMHIRIASDVSYDSFDQQTILSNAAHGLWPFFMPTSTGAVSNTVRFNSASGMLIETIRQPDNPIVIGANVLNIARYLGH